MVDMATNDIVDSFSLFRREIARLRALEVKKVDVGPKQMQILYHLLDTPLTMGEIAAFTVSDKASATRAVASLETAGYVKKAGSESDRRVCRVELTPKGRTKAAKALEIRDRIGDAINETLTPAERKQLSLLLLKVGNTLRERREAEQGS